jgi:hypothetical protein
MMALVGRDPDLSRLIDRPFGRRAAHHRPVGRGLPGADAINNPGAYYGIPGTSGPATRGRMAVVTEVLLPGPVGTKFHRQVAATDPMRTIMPNPGGAGVNIPAEGVALRVPAKPPYPPETAQLTDSNVLLYPRNGGRVDVGDMFFQARFLTEYRATLRRQYGLSGIDRPGDGMDGGPSASRMRWPSSMLRFDVMRRPDPGPIRHCLHMLATRKTAPSHLHVLGKTWVWPAAGRDSSAGAIEENLGDIPYGTRFVIRWSDKHLRNELGLTARGLRLFDCLLHYGFYVVDGTPEHDEADGGASVTFRTDQGFGGSAPAQWPEPMRSEIIQQLRILVPLCWPVRNVRPLDEETEVWTDGTAYASGGGPLYPDTACTAWDH